MFSRLRALATASMVVIATLAISTVASAQSITGLHLGLGNPSGATTSTSNYTNYLMQKPQFSLSYSRYDGIPNWVSWHLGKKDLGSASRSSSFTTDTTLPSGWYRVTTSDYTNSGFDRGHNCPSADRTYTSTDNKATFVMTNIMPQAPDNNQGPWADLENYCRSLVNAGNELYIISVTSGSGGTLAGGKVLVPEYVSKIIVVLPDDGKDSASADLARINSNTRIIAIDMPNVQGIRNDDWRDYRVSVDDIEYWTGYNFLSSVSSSIQSTIEARVDNL